MRDFMHALNPQAAFVRGLRKGGRVLDVGCGDFSRIHRYVGRIRPDLDITGIEREADSSIYGPLPSPPVREGLLPYRRLACDVAREQFPFEDGAFDGVYFSHVIEHLDDASHAILEICRVLRSGGICYVETPGPSSAKFKRPWCVNPTFGGTINYYDDETHVGEPFTRERLAGALSKAELSVISQGTFREFGLFAMPAYISLSAVALLPVFEENLRSQAFGAGVRNLIGFGIYAIAMKTLVT